jgi:hypothetical protein
MKDVFENVLETVKHLELLVLLFFPNDAINGENHKEKCVHCFDSAKRQMLVL